MFSSPDVVCRRVDEPSITSKPVPAAVPVLCERPMEEMPVVLAVPPPPIRSVPSPSCPMENRGPADVPASVSTAVPPFLMMALSATPGTVPVLQLVPVLKFPEPVAIHETSAASLGTLDMTATAARATPACSSHHR